MLFVGKCTPYMEENQEEDAQTPPVTAPSRVVILNTHLSSHASGPGLKKQIAELCLLLSAFADLERPILPPYLCIYLYFVLFRQFHFFFTFKSPTHLKCIVAHVMDQRIYFSSKWLVCSQQHFSINSPCPFSIALKCHIST